ncbi:MAG: MOSC domain-containing protein [Pseudomonadota bacterium]
MQGTLGELIKTHVRHGRIEWIGVRPERKADVVTIEIAQLGEAGLEGDHARPGNRALTLIQAEHLPVIASFAGHNAIDPALLRRNLVVSGINLVALRKVSMTLGDATIQLTAPCPPCSRMEAALGQGGYNAMRGHGGWYARVLSPGRLKIGDALTPIQP